MANTDIIPDIPTVNVGTLGVIADFTTFQQSAAQGERFVAVDAKRAFIAVTTAGVSDAEVIELATVEYVNEQIAINSMIFGSL